MAQLSFEIFLASIQTMVWLWNWQINVVRIASGGRAAPLEFEVVVIVAIGFWRIRAIAGAALFSRWGQMSEIDLRLRLL